MATRTRWLPFVAAMLVGAALPRQVLADLPREELSAALRKDMARALAIEGFNLFQSGETQRAIAPLLEAEKLYHAPTILLLLAQAHAKLGKVVEARAFYKSIMEEPMPRSAPREFFEAKVDAKRGYEALEGRFATIQVVVPGATSNGVKVMIDGAEMTPFDAVHPQNPGTHSVKVSGSDGTSVTQMMSLQAGDSERLLVPFAAIDPYGSGSLVAPAAVAFGVGVAGLGAGVATGILALTKADDIDEACASGPCSAREEAQSAEKLGLVSMISFAAGGAGLATSAILLYVGRQGRTSTGVTAVSSMVRASIGPGQITITGTF